MMEIVRKHLDFVDDQSLQIILQARLEELEKVFSVNANLSTIILSISCIEGIFKHIANIFKDMIKASSAYPRKDGKKKDFSKLTIEDIYRLLLEREILQPIDNFDQIHTLFRNYRNFIHPQKQAKKSWPLGLGQAQMALGLLNATIDQISNYIFIGTDILKSISGRPRFDLSKVLHLDLSNIRTHSFVLLKRKIESDLGLKFEVDLGQSSILNFVFDFENESKFKMLRLDRREDKPNALLYSKQKHHWDIVAKAECEQPPEGIFTVKISIRFQGKRFEFFVNGKTYKFINNNGDEINLFPEIRKGLQIGFFNEVGPVKLSNIRIVL
jgi:hypothetical protein